MNLSAARMEVACKVPYKASRKVKVESVILSLRICINPVSLQSISANKKLEIDARV